MTTMIESTVDDGLVRAVLRANALFCITSGLVLGVLSGPIADFIDAPRWALVAIGVGLVPWGAMLLAFSRRTVINRSSVWTAIAGDDLWVVGSIVLVAGFPTVLNPTGNGLTIVVAIIVAAFAVVQVIGLRRLMSSPGA